MPAAAPPRPAPHRSRRSALRARSLTSSFVVPALIASVLAGCGSSHQSGSAADPAALAPAAAPLYAGATVRPGGMLKSDALSAGSSLTHQADPYLRLLAALQTPGSPALSFGHDIAPWLGPHAGVFLSSLGSAGALSSLLQQGLLGGASTGGFPFGAGRAQGAIVLDTTDVAKARGFLDAQARRAGAHASSYRGVAYQVGSGGASFAVVSRAAVIGSESGVHEVIDTALGAPSLARQAGYAKLLAAAPSDALAHVYAAASAGASTTPSASAAGPEGISGIIGVLSGGQQANVSLVPAAAALTLDADTLQGPASGGAAGLLAADPEGATALGELPGESWLAVGLGHVATNLASDVQALGALTSLVGSPTPSAEGTGAGGLNVKSLLAGLLAPLKALGANTAQARRDYARWMGSAGIFASGGSLLELKAAVVIASKDPAASRAAVTTLADQLRRGGASLRPVSIPSAEAAIGVASSGLPVVLDLASGRSSNGQTKFVLGFGEASVGAALNPPSSLSSAAPRNAAGTALGEGIQPSLIVDFPTLLSLLEGVGLTGDPTISKLVPYLRAATTLAGGGHSLGGGIERFRLVLGLHPAG